MRTRPSQRTTLAFAIAVACVFASGGAPAGQDRIVQRAGQPDVYLLPADDAGMAAATAAARGSIDQFIAAFAAPAAGQHSFAVKVPVIDGTLVEEFWLDLDAFENGQFRGRIANEPCEVQNVHFGDRMVADEERIIDWMYVEDGHLVGGYSIRALRGRLSAAERKAFDAALPFVIAD
jgi:uncharacterized protein YegJ (DUF2314 family)